MSNLLPQKNQKRIWNEYRARFVLAGSLLMMAAAGISLFALISAQTVLRASLPIASAQNEQQKGDTTEIVKAQTLVRQIRPIVVASTTLSGILSDVLDKRPNGVRVDGISYSLRNPPSLMITGVAEDRTEINAYRSILQSDPRFAAVFLPVGDLIGAQGGRFTLTLTGNF